MKIVVLDGYTLNPGDLSWDELAKLGDITMYDRTPPESIIRRSRGAQALMTNKAVLDANSIKQLRPDLQYIGVLATGYNIVDVVAATNAGVVVTNVPGYGSASVAQHTFALALELLSHVAANDASVKAGEWSSSLDWSYSVKPQVELSGKVLGIVGLGQIGQQVARIGQGFGMRVAYNSPSARSESHYEYCPLEDLVGISDVISLHCPLTDQNHGMIDAHLLGQMKKTAILINTSRGPLVKEKDLAAALTEGRLAGAGLDVLSSEPPAADNPLIAAPNCIITPHNAWATREARTRLLGVAVENLRLYQQGQSINVIT